MSMPPVKQKNKEINLDNDLNNYKGIYFGGDNEQTYFEAGAHFRYKDLCAKLEKIVMSLTPDRRGKTMYEDSLLSNRKEPYSMERTKADSRKIASECSKATNSAPKSNHISPSTVRARNIVEGYKNKKHHVSQEKPTSIGKNSVQGKIVINTIKTNKISNNNMTKQYIKKVNPNFVLSSSNKNKDNKYGFIDAKKSMKARILEITEKDSFSQPNAQSNISSVKISNNMQPISSKNTNETISSRKFFTYNHGSFLSRKAENSRRTIEKSFKQSVDSSTPSDLKSDSRRKNDLLVSNVLKSRNLGKFDLFKSANKENKSIKNNSIDNGRLSNLYNNTKGTSSSIVSKTVNKINPTKTHFSQYKVNLKDKKYTSPLIKNKLLVSKGNMSFIKDSYKLNNLSQNQKKERTNSLNVKKVFSTTYGTNFKKIK